MVLKVSSPKAGNLSASEYVSDPEDKEISDDDDDDRNHKHRRRDARSGSSDKDAVEQGATRTYRKHNKTSGNGNGFGESESQSSQLHNNYNTSSERHFPGKFEKRNMEFGRANFSLNQRNRANQPFFGDSGPGRGRGRDSGVWNNRHNRFMTGDLSSQIVPFPRGNMASSLFPERGLPPVPNVHGGPWGGYGLVAGLPNGGLDTLHPIGLQGPFRPPISNSLGIPRQRCRDFEERGFCLRGDMCPMEHGINRIVVEDVQSLSQFNLPVSLSSGPLPGTPAVPGSLPSVSFTSSLMNIKGPHNRNGKHTVGDEALISNGAFSDSGNGAGADVYDPDQPLWNNNGPEKSSALHSSPFSETGALLNDDLPGHPIAETAEAEWQDRNNLPAGSHGTGSSVWGRMKSTRGKVNVKREGLDNSEGQIKETEGATSNVVGGFNHGKQIIADGPDKKALDPAKMASGAARLTRRPTQKALQTLFVNGVPLKNNRRDALLSHFKKFGTVVDIHIPTNSERAFVQFSKREEAEAALNSPDAVMGNRFIKLWWANRDNIPSDGINGVTGISSSQHGIKSNSALPDISIPSKGKDISQSGILIPDGPGSHPDQSKSSTPGPKVSPPLVKNLELERLKEELRKKQEMLEQKRNDFKRQLDKLQKATGVKGEVTEEQVSKKQKVVAAAGDDAKAAATPKSADFAAAGTARSSDNCNNVASSHEEVMDGKAQSVEIMAPSRPDTNSPMGPQQHPFSLRQQQLRSAGISFFPNRYKLDNRPTTFRITPPLPAGFANVDTLKEHFSSYGDLTVVELEDAETHPDDEANGVGTLVEKCSARVGFRERHSAERAFNSGKSWQGHSLQFIWILPTSTAASSATKKPKLPDDTAEKVPSAASSGEPVPSEREKAEEEKVEVDEVPVAGPTSLSNQQQDRNKDDMNEPC